MPLLPAVANAAVTDSVSDGRNVEVPDVQTPSLLKVDRIRVAHKDSTLDLSFTLNPKRVNPGRDRQIVFTPIVVSNNPEVNDSIVLPSVTIAGRNRYYSHLRNGDIEAGDNIHRAGVKGAIEYTGSMLWQPWMESAYLYMREETQDCCRPVKPLCDTPLAQIGTRPEKKVDTTNSVGYLALTGDSVIEREAQGSAFIDFVVNRTEIREDYRGNAAELRKIIESIDFVKNDPDAIITRLTVKGFASPEGSYANNVRLAAGRTESLKEYIRRMYSFPEDIMLTSYEPEDWEGLRRWLADADISHRDAILAIVNSDLAPDPKDAAIRKQFPKEYEYILKNVYPALRHSDYTVHYRIKTFVELEDLMRVFKENPKNLRPVDFYRIAQTYPVGSPEFDQVLLIASDIYPYDQEAAINAANILLKRGELKEASKKLVNAGESGEAYYTRGMVALANDDTERAAIFFKKAEESGIADARNMLKAVDERKGPREDVIYFIKEENPE